MGDIRIEYILFSSNRHTTPHKTRIARHTDSQFNVNDVQVLGGFVSTYLYKNQRMVLKGTMNEKILLNEALDMSVHLDNSENDIWSSEWLTGSIETPG